ncbi:hypothetical protein [Xylanimonas cellulosilytica]|uniref:hypothetical protein n=1 Tax=Xylanimonas cellulosilytica TaxID=186189 RepID=UPI00031CC335
MHPLVVAALAEKGIDISAEEPKALTTEAVAASDIVVITTTRKAPRTQRFRWSEGLSRRWAILGSNQRHLRCEGQ